MSTKLYGMIELLVFFGGILAFCLWQLRAVRRVRHADRRGEADETAGPGKKSPEDIFWDTVTRLPKRD